ncbi:MAG: hypoxanthine phosphoribosyltransferase [Selenomonadaceae bacterium]|nr:hypoxanthine phosphoribosyltransferase [Selenomonadaceae bacterium]
MTSDIEKILYTEKEIHSRVQEMGEEISKEYSEIYSVGILKGASIFYADLVRAVKIPVMLDFMMVSSYGAESVTSGKVDIKKDLERDISGKDLLIVEDIIDTGITMKCLSKILKERGAKSVKIAALLSKPDRREVEVDIDYLGFSVPDEFLVGYGLDYAEKYRNLPFIGVLKRSVYE